MTADSSCGIIHREIKVRFKFIKKKTSDLYYSDKGAHRYPEGVVNSFSEAMAVIEAAKDEGDLRNIRGLDFKKRKGKPGKRVEHSLRLNKQYRLIFIIEKDDGGKFLDILGIEKH